MNDLRDFLTAAGGALLALAVIVAVIWGLYLTAPANSIGLVGP